MEMELTVFLDDWVEVGVELCKWDDLIDCTAQRQEVQEQYLVLEKFEALASDVTCKHLAGVGDQILMVRWDARDASKCMVQITPSVTRY
jgi:hypothetical protein